MAWKELSQVDMANNSIINMLLEIIAGNASSPIEGRIWYDSTNQTIKFANNLGSPIDILSLSNATGTTTSAKISDFATAVEAIALSAMSAPTADVPWNSHKITGVLDPTNPQDASTKNYVDTTVASNAAGITYKQVVTLATVVNDTLSGLAARDGVTPTAGQRVLVKAQTTGSANGIYIAGSSAWTRSTDFAAGAVETGGVVVSVDQGTINAHTMWMLASDVTVGTTSQTWNPFGSGTTYTAGNGISIISGVIAAVTAAASGLINPTASGGLAVDFTQVIKKYVNTFTGDGTTKTFAVTHNLNNIAPGWSIYNGTQQYGGEFQPSGANGGSFSFGTAPQSGTFSYTMWG